MIKGIAFLVGVLAYFLVAYYSLFSVSTELINMVA